MKIVEVNLTENVTEKVGLRPLSMKKLGNTILLAGKNGSGKTRILDIIRNQTANLSSFLHQKNQSETQIKQLKMQIAQQPQQKQNIESEIKQYQKQITQIEGHISQQPQLKQKFEQQIKNLQNRITELENQISQQPQLKESIEQQIKIWQEISDTPQPIITDTGRQDIVIVDFVPNKIELEDWSNQNKQKWMQRADQAIQLGVSTLHQATLPLIQKILDRWVNTTHPNLEYSDNDKQESLKDYKRLQDIIKSFLGTHIGWNKDGYSTIFDRPVAQAQLSAGQRILLQLCVAIYSQGGNLSNHILFMDEPENHLHPSAVIDLLDTIRKNNPNGQIWIATHSIPLLSHFDASGLWFVDDRTVRHSGKKPEAVLRSLLGNEERIQKLKDFTSLPYELARNRFAFECLCPPNVVETDSSDPQSKQLYDQLKIIWEGKDSINLLDFGAGKGRMIANLADYENVSPDKLNYHAFDPTNSDKEQCLKNIALSYPDEVNRYHNSIESLRSKVDDNFFDVVVLSNVLHEIPHQSWCELFSNIKKLLSIYGYLLIIEDCRIPTGELAHNNGFIVLNTLHLKKIFKIPASEVNFIIHDARFDSKEHQGRLMAHLIPANYLDQITSETIIDALSEVKNSAKEEIRKIRRGEITYSNGLAHSFWVQQLANAVLCLTDLGKE
ncbi:methyltransferase domain-containing protein [Leptospira noumeaensis]|uniref:Methyltransferase domain-containing protein n=1 Tax=Leptospira noumeaensis TaxID=2484964 RepID=A0A4R9IET2_9LEPT|nr:AAA family ATPase [Leptospira noumeaensis]TGK86130.1 methyltransferase domain-containing protein [Leptospira noumeaensis]